MASSSPGEGRDAFLLPGIVQFGPVSAPGAVEWTATAIRPEVPSAAAKGPTVIIVNPAQGSRIVGIDTPFDVV